MSPSDTATLPSPTAMADSMQPGEGHYVNRIGWLRAAVLGANDGLLSTGSLMSGVAAAAIAPGQLVLTGVAGIVAGAMSMAAGEYVSVSSQADTEAADRRREAQELKMRPRQEMAELKAIYKERGLNDALADQVARELMQKDALEAHMRDELGISDATTANPLQAALASAASFITGGLPPLAVAVLAPGAHVLALIMVVTIAMLALLGAVGARAGGAPMVPGVMRVVIFGTAAMVVTALAGHLFHAAV